MPRTEGCTEAGTSTIVGMIYHEDGEHTFENGEVMTDQERRQAPLGWCGKCMTRAHDADKRRIAVALVNGTGLCVTCLEKERIARTFGGYGRPEDDDPDRAMP